MPEYAVWAETKSGQSVILRRGYSTRESAENHRVVLAEWRKVWIEPFQPAKASQ